MQMCVWVLGEENCTAGEQHHVGYSSLKYITMHHNPLEYVHVCNEMDGN